MNIKMNVKVKRKAMRNRIILTMQCNASLLLAPTFQVSALLGIAQEHNTKGERYNV